MESISDILDKRPEASQEISKSKNKILMNYAVTEFILKEKLTDEQVTEGLAKLNEFVSETEKFSESDSTYQPILVMNEGRIDVSYRETDLLLKIRRQKVQAARVTLVGLPQTMKEISWKRDVYGQITNRDKGRMPAIRAIESFMSQPEGKKGVYLFGDFGVGKSFLMAGMITKLAESGVHSQMIHYPTFIAQPNFAASEQVDEVKRAQLLVLDDIGGEVNSNWARDNVLQVILQYRMDNVLPTFFTANYSMKNLEERLAQTNNGVDTWAAKRVMERVKFLADEIHLEGENRRHE